MILITGLGNPGKQYENTRHNAGFMALDAIKDIFSYNKDYIVEDWVEDKYLQSEICVIRKGTDISFILQKPQTFMNNSGQAVYQTVKKYNVKTQDYILIFDDLDIKLGKYKIDKEKLPKVHNGVNSVVQRLGGKTDFTSLKIGTDNRLDRTISGEALVLMQLTKEERELLDITIKEAVNQLLAEL